MFAGQNSGYEAGDIEDALDKWNTVPVGLRPGVAFCYHVRTGTDMSNRRIVEPCNDCPHIQLPYSGLTFSRPIEDGLMASGTL
jgi:hypothetical protein